MSDIRINWYLNFIRDELTQLRDNNFHGNIEYKINIVNGKIQNMTNGLHKSLKMSEDKK